MFFLAFATSIRIFTLFLNLLNSEIFLIPAIILVAIIFAFFTTPQPSAAPLTGSKKPKKQKISSL
jgi:phage-related protein